MTTREMNVVGLATAPDPHHVHLTRDGATARDDALIIAAGRFGDVLGGGRRPTAAEREDLRELHRVLDRLSFDPGLLAVR